MSYLRRVAQRAAGVPTGAGMIPSGRSTSPLASFDQRLNLVPSLASGARRADGSTSSIDGGIDSLADPFATAVASPLGVPTGSIDATAGGPAIAPRSARTSTERPAFSAASPVSFPSPVPRASTGAPALGDSSPVVAALAENARPPHATVRSRTQPAEARAPLAEAARAAADVASARAKDQRTALGTTRLQDSGARADEEVGHPAPPAPRAREALRTPAPFGAPEGSSRGRDPVADALAKLDRWLGSEPRAEGKSRPVPGADQRGEAGAGPRGGAAPGPRSPAAARRLFGGRGGPSFHAAPPAPILRIGRIEVQVVMPTPPAAIATAAPRPRASSPAAAPAGSWLGPPAHLTFGLRQR